MDRPRRLPFPARQRNPANSTATTTTTNPGSSYDLLLTGRLRF